MLDMVRRRHPRLATLAPAALRNWPATNVSCRPRVCEGLDFIEQKSLVMTTTTTTPTTTRTIDAVHSCMQGDTSSNPFNYRLATPAYTLPRRIITTGIIFD